MLQSFSHKMAKMLTISILVLTFSIVVFASSAHAAPISTYKALGTPCYNTGCYNLDPYSLDNGYCASNLTETTAVLKINGQTIATVWNDYSIPCDANWAQAQLGSYALQHNYSLTVEIQWASGNSLETQCYPFCSNPIETAYGYSGSAIAWTNMIGGTPYTYAYVFVYDSSGAFVGSISKGQ